jgi:hypothetical protein
MSDTAMIEAAVAARRFEAEMRGARATPMLHQDEPGQPIRRPNGKPVLNSLSFSGATELAAKIRDYWAEQGHVVETRVEAFTADRGSRYAVRFDLVDGLPRQEVDSGKIRFFLTCAL